MRIIRILPREQTIILGRKGENLVTRVEVDVRSWLEEFPGSQFELLIIPAGRKDGYLAATVLEDGILSWTILEDDLSVDGDGTA